MTFDIPPWRALLYMFRVELVRLGIHPKYLRPADLERGPHRIWPLRPVPRG